MTLEGGLLGVIVVDGVSLRIRDGELVDEGEHQTLKERRLDKLDVNFFASITVGVHGGRLQLVNKNKVLMNLPRQCR